MLKFKKLETYYPDKKILNLLEQTTNDKVITTNGIARSIEKTNIKQVSPVIYETKINNKDFLLCHYRNEEIKAKRFYTETKSNF